MEKFSPHQLTSNVKLLHKVAVVVDNKVLIVKRSKQANSRPEKWDLPGGNSEWPQQSSSLLINLHQQDIVREIQEETGLITHAEKYTENNLVYFATYFEPDKQIYSINCGWVITSEPNFQERVKLSFEHTEFRWIGLKELDQYDFGGSSRDFETRIIRQALK